MLEKFHRFRTESERRQRKLREALTKRSRQPEEVKRAAMVHMIAHDLRNPLLGMRMTAERLVQLPSGNEPGRKLLKDLASSADLALGMVDEMLDFYHVEFENLPLCLSFFRIEDSIQASLYILAPQMDEKRLKAVRTVEPPDLSLLADKRRVTRLLTNLIANAIRFSPESGRVYVSAASMETEARQITQVRVRVEDEGEGVPEKELSSIFDRFFSHSDTRGETGTGLGLSYCKLVAEAHGGDIWARNRASGGLDVCVVLPGRPDNQGGAYDR